MLLQGLDIVIESGAGMRTVAEAIGLACDFLAAPGARLPDSYAPAGIVTYKSHHRRAVTVFSMTSMGLYINASLEVAHQVMPMPFCVCGRLRHRTCIYLEVYSSILQQLGCYSRANSSWEHTTCS